MVKKIIPKRLLMTFFKERNIPGFTYQTDWNFPGFNRDHTLQECLKADHQCDWILRMDADERLQVDENFDWSILDDISVDSYNIVAEAGDTRYFRTWFWNAQDHGSSNTIKDMKLFTYLKSGKISKDLICHTVLDI